MQYTGHRLFTIKHQKWAVLLAVNLLCPVLRFLFLAGADGLSCFIQLHRINALCLNGGLFFSRIIPSGNPCNINMQRKLPLIRLIQQLFYRTGISAGNGIRGNRFCDHASRANNTVSIQKPPLWEERGGLWKLGIKPKRERSRIRQACLWFYPFYA